MAKGQRTNPKRTTFFLTVEEHFDMTEAELLDRLHHWLQYRRDTTIDCGFDLKSVSVSAQKHKEIL